MKYWYWSLIKKYWYWVFIPLAILSYVYGPTLLALLDFDPPVPANQAMVETELRKMYGDKLKVFTLSEKENLPNDLSHENAIVEFIPVKAPANGTIVGYQMLTNTNGQLHHFNLWDKKFKHPFCEQSHKIVYQVGVEMTPTWFLEGYGYPIKKGQELVGEVMWHNHDHKGVNANLKLKIFYVEEDLKPITPVLFDIVDPCITGHVYVPINKEATFESGKEIEIVVKEGDELVVKKQLGKELEITQDAKVLSFGGHCHAGCERIALLVNGEVKDITIPIEGVLHHEAHDMKVIEKINPTVVADDFILKKGDKVGISAYYNNVGEFEQYDAMVMYTLILEMQ